jgi:hypothetical protein
MDKRCPYRRVERVGREINFTRTKLIYDDLETGSKPMNVVLSVLPEEDGEKNSVPDMEE